MRALRSASVEALSASICITGSLLLSAGGAGSACVVAQAGGGFDGVAEFWVDGFIL